jgi:NAD(P)-dependent dehydrogenase (short-subunit alcohol dehydrogenase family)
MKGKLAIVTGGGTGIGAACAKELATAGCHVVVTGRHRETLDPIANSIQGTALTCDVTDPEQVQSMFSQAREITGKVDVLVNNAGIPGPIAPIAQVDLEQWRSCIDINLFGALYCLQAAAKIMTEQQSGSIINMSSRMGIQGYPMRSAYCEQSLHSLESPSRWLESLDLLELESMRFYPEP